MCCQHVTLAARPCVPGRPRDPPGFSCAGFLSLAKLAFTYGPIPYSSRSSLTRSVRFLAVLMLDYNLCTE